MKKNQFFLTIELSISLLRKESHHHSLVKRLSHTLYPGCNIFVYIADQKQPNTSHARMDCGKLTLFLLLQTLKRGVASQDFAEKHSVPTFMFRHKQ